MKIRDQHNRLSLISPPRLALTLAATATLMLSGGDALACGGLFCSNSNPVNQAAERIIFSQNPDDTVSAVIEIQYEGPAHEFGWVLPVPRGKVDVGVSSKQILDALQQASNPVFNLQRTFESCGDDGDDADTSFDSTSKRSESAGDEDSEQSGVVVVAQGNAGPYDYVQLELDDALDDPAEVALKWLKDNDYDVPALGPDVLRPYLEENMDLLAFKLSKKSGKGSVRPIFLTYKGQDPVIPIRPTAVAALENMGIMVWVLGESRAIPKNYLHLELNEAKIDWFNPQATYNDVVIAAADEAGGQGFVTEQSGPARAFQDSLYPDFKQEEWDRIRDGQYSTLEQFFNAVRGFAVAPALNNGQNLFGDVESSGSGEYLDGFLDVLSDPEIFPLREGANVEQFLACIDCYFEENVAVRTDAYPSTPYVPGEDPLDDIDIAAFFDEMERLVIDPLQKTRELFEDHKTVTRFYTTLSPDEMSVDPLFSFNPDLGPVDNTHTAEQRIACDGESWTITLPQGTKLRGSARTWPVEVSDTVPVNFRVSQLSTSGNADVITDNQMAIIETLETEGLGGGADVPEGTKDTGGVVIEGVDSDAGSSSGCVVVPASSSRAPLGALLALIGLVLGSRARRCSWAGLRNNPSRVQPTRITGK